MGLFRYSKNPVFQSLKLLQSPGDSAQMSRHGNAAGQVLVCVQGLLGLESNLMPADVCGRPSTEVRECFVLCTSSTANGCI